MTLTGVQPRGAAVGAHTTVLIEGEGLGGAIGREAELACAFVPPDAAGTPPNASTPAAVVTVGVAEVTSTAVRCAPLSPAAAAAGVVVQLRAPGSDPPALDATAGFVWFDRAASIATAVAPAGLPAGTDGRVISVHGSGFVDLGAISCRVGAVVGAAALLSSTELACTLPLLLGPSALGETRSLVEVSPNGVSYYSSNATLTVYAAVVESSTPVAMPALAPVAVTLTGRGFAQLGAEVAACVYRADADAGSAAARRLSVAASVVGSTTAVCAPMPAGFGAAGSRVSVRLSLNGEPSDLAPDDRRGGAGVALYDLGAIVLSAVDPVGGPVLGGTRVTVSGVGFGGELADGGLCCALDGACAAAASLVPGPSSSSTVRAVCTLPAAGAAGAGSRALELSLRSGAPGTFTASGLRFAHHAEPSVLGVLPPREGDPRGGQAVTVVGSGFGALLDAAGLTAAEGLALGLPRVRFGANPAPAPLLSLTDGQLVVRSPFGAAASRALVAVALNGRQFVEPAAPFAANATFTYLDGLHAPALLGARFNSEATALVLQFDPQPTDRAGMVGVQPCSVVLDDDSVARVQGGASAAPDCFWTDDSTLFVRLNAQTALAPGDTVAVRDDVLRPRGSAAPCPDELCALDASAAIPLEPSEACIGGCPQPRANLAGPTTVSVCPGQRVLLRAAGSAGGGVVPLEYAWSVEPTGLSLAAAAELGAQLEGVSAPSVEVLLPTGTLFRFRLEASSFLGLSSARAQLDVAREGTRSPTVSVAGPSRRSVRPGAALALHAVAQPAACWPAGSRSSRINFRWALLSATPTDGSEQLDASAPPAPFDAAAAARAGIKLAPWTLRAGYTYSLQVTASMAGDRAARARALLQLEVASQPVRATIGSGDRTISMSAEPVVLDGSGSVDGNTGSGASLLYEWSVVRAGADGAEDEPVPLAPSGIRANASSLALPPAALGGVAGDYAVTLRASSADGRADSASVLLTLVAAYVPTVSVRAPEERAQYNARWRVPAHSISFVATLVDARAQQQLAAANGTFEYAWRALELGRGEQAVPARARDGGPLELADATRITATGDRLSTLVFRSGVLTPGATYVLELTVSGGELPAVARVSLEVNRPPYGGVLRASPAEVAALSRLELVASGWTDDTDGLPLRYAFGYVPEGASTEQRVTSTPSLEERASAVLPEGEHVALLTVLDQFDGIAWGSALVRVTALAAANRTAETARRAVADARVALDTEDGDRAAQLVAAIAASTLAEIGGSTADGGGAEADEMVNELLAVIATVLNASAFSLDEGSRALASSAIVSVVESAQAMGEGAQSEALTQLSALVDAARASDGLDELTASNSMRGLDAVLAAARSAAARRRRRLAQAAGGAAADGGGSGDDATNAAIQQVVSSLASGLTVGVLPGEAARELLGTSVCITALRAIATSLLNATLPGPGGAGALSLPPTALDGVLAQLSNDGGVDVQLVSLQRNVHDALNGTPADGAGSSGLALGAQLAFSSGLFSVKLLPADGTAELQISGLADEIEITLPLDSSAGVGGANATCTADADCAAPGDAPRGACNASTGACACDAGFSAALCDEIVLCHFWNDTAQRWSTSGCETRPGETDGSLVCACNHLTDFAAIAVAIKGTVVDGEDAGSISVNLPLDVRDDDLASAARSDDPGGAVVVALGDRLLTNYWAVGILASLYALALVLSLVASRIDRAVETRPEVPKWKQNASKGTHSGTAWKFVGGMLKASMLTWWAARLPGERVTAKQKLMVQINLTLLELSVIALFLGQAADSAAQLVFAAAISVAVGFPMKAFVLLKLWAWAAKRRGLYDENPSDTRSDEQRRRSLRASSLGPSAMPFVAPVRAAGAATMPPGAQAQPTSAAEGRLGARPPPPRSHPPEPKGQSSFGLAGVGAWAAHSARNELLYVAPSNVRSAAAAEAQPQYAASVRAVFGAAVAARRLQRSAVKSGRLGPRAGARRGGAQPSAPLHAVEMPAQSLIAMPVSGGFLVGFFVAGAAQAQISARLERRQALANRPSILEQMLGVRLGAVEADPAQALAREYGLGEGTGLLDVRFVQAEYVYALPPISHDDVHALFDASPRDPESPTVPMVRVQFNRSPFVDGRAVRDTEVLAAPDVVARTILAAYQLTEERAKASAPHFVALEPSAPAELTVGTIERQLQLTHKELRSATWWMNKPKPWKRWLVWGINAVMCLLLTLLLLAFSLLGVSNVGTVDFRNPDLWRDRILLAWALKQPVRLLLAEPIIVVVNLAWEPLMNRVPANWRMLILRVCAPAPARKIFGAVEDCLGSCC